MNSTGKSASEWAMIMAELRACQPRPIHKLWNNPALAPVEAVAVAKATLSRWNSEYRRASKMQKIALEQDNAAFWAAQGR